MTVPPEYPQGYPQGHPQGYPHGYPPPPPQPYSGGYGQPYPMPPQPAGTNWWAVVSLVFGVLGAVLISVVAGIVGLSKASKGQGGRSMAIAGLVLSGVWMLVGVALIAFLVANKDDIFDPSSVSASDIGLGDCLAEIPSDASLVASVQTVDCAEPHKGEVYYVVDVPGDDFPGQAAIIEYQDRCQPALREFSPAAMADPEVGMFVLYPTEDSWRRGDHAVTCIATTDLPRTGSLRG